MSQDRSSFIAFGGVALAVLLLVFMVNSANTRNLDASIIGTRGLSQWLSSQNIDAQQASFRTGLAEEDVALRILPLYDTNIDYEVDFFTEEPSRENTTQRDLYRWVVEEKVQRTPTLIVLPKWRRGVIELNLFDEQLLINPNQIDALLAQLDADQLRTIISKPKLLEEDGIVLYRPQLLKPSSVTGDCRPHMSLDAGVLIAECKSLGNPFYVLTDPDLLNNHGLALGDNAAVAVDIIGDLISSRQGTVFIDHSQGLILQSENSYQPPEQPRSAEELSRFLTYPFNLIFLGSGITFLILIWRGLIRFGPPKRMLDTTHAASKSASIDAKGYLLRLAGEDHALLQAYVTDKMQSLARDVMGKATGIDQPQFIKRLRKIAPQNAAELRATIAQIDSTTVETPQADLARLTETFDDIYRRLRDELGHVSRHG